MKYIKIKNAGEIEPEALHLVGASTKRNDNTKIGQFGSGNKYALAYLLREGYNVKIFGGLNEITIETHTTEYRGQTFNVIWINGKETSITTQMGKDWKFWQAIREIYCNAIDEGDFTLDFVSVIDPRENETHFYIENIEEAAAFMGNFNDYFATNKKVLFECKLGRILEKTGTTGNIYRRGIRCFETPKFSVFDYDFNDIDIDENRLVKYFWQIEEKIWSLIYQCEDKETILRVLHSSSDRNYLEGCLSEISAINSTVSDVFRDTLKSLNLAPSGFAGCLNPDEVHNHIIIPTKIYTSVRGIIGDENVGDKFKVTRKGAFYVEKDANPLEEATIAQALDFFKECHYPINYDIKVATFDNKSVYGAALNNIIYLSDICLERGVNEVCNTIIEEQIHLKYEVKDETRDFQDAVIAEFVTYMKTNNSYLL